LGAVSPIRAGIFFPEKITTGTTAESLAELMVGFLEQRRNLFRDKIIIGTTADSLVELMYSFLEQGRNLFP
jgi:hypothetical protein